MTAGNIRNRHPGLGCLLDHGKLLIRRVPAPALDAGKDFYSINTVRHSRKTRRTPSSYLMRLCPVQIGAAPIGVSAYWFRHVSRLRFFSQRILRDGDREGL